MRIPQRKSLLLQVVESLRDALQSGTWEEFLPGERELSRRLHVSRPSVRSALEILAREKLIENSPGKPRKILKPLGSASKSKSNTVMLLAKIPLYQMSRNRLFLFNALNQTLQENDIRLEVFHHEGLGSDKPHIALKMLEKKMNSGAYILALTSREVQEWFVAKGVPTLVLGSSFPGINLPSIECCYPTLGRHAAGTLLGKGHRQIALISPAQPLAGDQETELAFREEVGRSSDDGRKCHILHHGSNPSELLAKWTKLQRDTPGVTAVFSIYPSAALAILSQLVSQQVRVPEEISILCRDGDPLCDWISPRLAHYRLPLKRFAVRLSGLVLEMLDAGNVPKRHTTIIPDLESEESLGNVPF